MLRVEICTEIVKKLDNIASTCCVSNWNGYGADPIPQNVISIVKNMLPFLNKDVEIFPTADQSIQLEVDIVGEGYFECVIQKDGSLEFFSAPASGSPLTDEQRGVLMSLFTIGARYMGMSREGWKRCFVNKPQKEFSGWTCGDTQALTIAHGMANCLDSLVSWSDPEPYDIAKALGVGK